MDHTNNDTIVILKGPDRVRKRPGVVFGSDGARGVARAVTMLLDIFITEAALGFCSELTVGIGKDHSVCIHSADRGFALDSTPVDGVPAWQADFCQLFAGPRHPDPNEPPGRSHHRLYGQPELPPPRYHAGDFPTFPDLCCVQYACEYMDVESVHNGTCSTLHFRKGHHQSGPHRTPTAGPGYTRIDFRADPEVFTHIDLPLAPLAQALQDAAVTVPGLMCSVTDLRDGTQRSWHYPLGTLDYVLDRTEGGQTPPFYTQSLEATGKDRYNRPEYRARARVVFGFAQTGSFTRCVHNYRRLEYGGAHLEAVQQQLPTRLAQHLLPDAPGAEQTVRALMDRAVLLLETNCSPDATAWRNASCTSIENRMICDMCADLFRDPFTHYLVQNRAAILALLH